jgi:hypothetical protein
VLINANSFIVYSILSIYIALCSAASSLPSSLICIVLISAPSNIVDFYLRPLPMTNIVFSGTVATCTLSCDFIAFVFKANHLACSSASCRYHEQHSCIVEHHSMMPLTHSCNLSNFIALTVVCYILSVSSHCNILSALLWTCCCGSIIVAFHRTTGSLPLHYWHHLPWCFLDELMCCGQFRLVNSGTMEWSHSQTL